MKIVQIGILVALIGVGALLFVVWRGQQQQQPAAAPAQGTLTTEPGPANPPEPVASTPPAAVPATPPARPTRPSPIPRSRNATSPAATTIDAGTPVVAETPAAQPAEPAPYNPPPPPAAQVARVSEPAPPPAAPPVPPQPRTVTMNAGTLISVRLAETLTTEKLNAGDAFSATIDRPLVVDGLAIAERGARVEGRVIEAVRAGRVKGVSSLSIHLTRLHTSDGQTVQIATDPFRKQGETSKAEDAKKVGIGAGIGAVIGAIAGGGKGAAIGAGVGGAAGGGAVAATRGEEVVLPVETRLDFRISSPVTLTEKR